MKLLVKRRENVNTNPGKGDMLYKAGDIVAVKPNSFVFGAQEDPSNFLDPADCGFWILQIPDEDATDDQIDRWYAPVVDEDQKILMRREWHVDVDAIAPVTRAALDGDGTVMVPWEDINDFIRNKGTGVSEDATIVTLGSFSVGFSAKDVTAVNT